MLNSLFALGGITVSRTFRVGLFLALAIACLTPCASPPLALGAGIAFALIWENPIGRESKWVSGMLLKVCVVLLGFGMDLESVLRAGVQGAAFAAATIGGTLLLGSWLGRRLGIARRTSMLISCGTAICGGSAIAAVGSVTRAEEGEMMVAIGTVFLLNAVGLYLFPWAGHVLHLTQTQFGTWAGVAIHDISSVVGAASRYGMSALDIATAVKLSRALWIVPVALEAARMFRGGERNAGEKSVGAATANAPWFIGLFLLASVARSVVPGVAGLAPLAGHLATVGLTLTLFLIGAGLSRKTLALVGWRPLVQGVVLWVFVSLVSLGVIVRFVA